MGRAPCCSKIGLRKGPWTAKEDTLLVNYIQTHGEGNWRSLPNKAGLLRCGKSCRLRWMNYLRPGIKRGNITSEEEDLIIRLHSLLGNRWSLIAGRIPGRTDNEIKNHWNSHLSKKMVNPSCNSPNSPNTARTGVGGNGKRKKGNFKEGEAEMATKIKIHQPKPTKVVTPIIFSISRDDKISSIGGISSNSNGNTEPLLINNCEDLDIPNLSPTSHVPLQDCNYDYSICENDSSGGVVFEKIYEEYEELLRVVEDPYLSEYAFVDSLLI